jgi:hypothetical protein
MMRDEFNVHVQGVDLTYLYHRVSSNTSISGYFKYHAFFIAYFLVKNI